MTNKDGAGFARLAEAVAAAPGDLARLDAPDRPLDSAEGHRLYLRYLTIGLELFIDYGDPVWPAFHSKTRDGVRKFAGDSPGQLYDAALVSFGHEYVVSGSMAETEFIEFSLYAGDLTGLNSSPRRMIASVTEQDLDVDEDGSFELRLDARGGRNALRMEPDANSISVRRYLRDPLRDRPRPLSIRRTTPAPPRAPLTSEDLAVGMEKAIGFARFNTRVWAEWAHRERSQRLNVLEAMPDAGDIHTPAGHGYLTGYWSLEPGQALTIEFTPDPDGYWSLVPMNFWMESFEWRFGDRVHATSFDTSPGRGGVVRLVLAEQDPGLAGHDWLATQGHLEGMIALRHARSAGPIPPVTTAVVRIP
ncbi:hypothetical protein [Nocardioides jensenii]|uniref:hypothetical protein n=1 Tax=Nocardioides jensenii TaxID=1843 RepID=UPI000830F5AC|nr:hypothetical protein [Nocardioides jensenii]